MAIEVGACVARQFFIGVDLGQARDHSAVAVVERAELMGERDAMLFAQRREIELRLRRLKRLPLGMRYPDIEDAVRKMTVPLAQQGVCELLVDATGVGRPVVDHLHLKGPGIGMRAVVVTGGNTEKSEDGFDYVPKQDLMTGLQVLFEYGELKIARTLKHLDALKKELADMRVRVTPAGNEQFGAWRQGEHDDLVFAVALACWGASKRYPGRLSGWDGHWVGTVNPVAWPRPDGGWSKR